MTRGKSFWSLRYCRPSIPARIAPFLSSLSIMSVYATRHLKSGAYDGQLECVYELCFSEVNELTPEM